MKITTFNVNGLRACLRKGVNEWWDDYAPDFLCLQEIKVAPHQLTKSQQMFLDPWLIHWNSAEKLGYSGVATFTSHTEIETWLGLGEEIFDREGRLLKHRIDDIYLYNVYFPSGQRGQGRVDYKLAFYERLLEDLMELINANEKVIVCGDFNTAHQEIDLYYPKQNVNTSGFLPEERAWVDKYLDNGLVDIYRYLYPDKEEYTWWTYRLNARERNIGWRLDYFLISENLIERVQDCRILNDVYGSDHCPVTLALT